jgi:hypothetical protein
MNANSLNWFQPDPQAQPGSVQAMLASTFEAWINAAQRAPQVPEAVQALNEQADRYEATQPGYAADLRCAAQRALRAGNGAA